MQNQSNHTEPTILFEHRGSFHDWPATYQTCQSGETQFDQIKFHRKPKVTPNDLIQQLKTTQLVHPNSVIITLHSNEAMALRFNYC